MKVTNIEVSAFRDVKISPYQKGMLGVKASVSLSEGDIALDVYNQIQAGLYGEVEAFALRIESEVIK